MVNSNPKARRGRPAVPDKSFKTLGYRVSSAYLDWIIRAAAVNGSTLSGLIEQAVSGYARAIGIEEAPPDRTA
jgi:uncharacterized protein (DUF1778 family)